MYCPRCGAKNPDGQFFCGKCGTRLVSPEVQPSGLGGLSPADLSERTFIQQRLGGKFEIRRELGRGGFGVVYEAFDVMLNRSVAIKALHLAQSGEELVVKRFIKEARLAAQLDHPNIVRIYTIDSAGPVHFFIMEFIDGQDIKKKLKKEGPFTPADTVRICKEIASALAYAHSKGIVHRDIKPHNIILKYGEIPVITDFGIAKALDSEATQLTSGALGSPHYISPEQLMNKPIDARADQYSLGAMMYEMLTGKTMFSGPGMTVLHKQISEKPKPLREVNPGIPEALAAIVHRLLEKDRNRRYASSGDVVRVLAELTPEDLKPPKDTARIKSTGVAETAQKLKDDIRKALNRRKYDLAIRLAERGKAAVPGDIEFVTLLKEAKERQETAEKAKVYVNEGIERFHDKQYTQAIEKWEQALELNDSNTDLPKFIERAKRLQNQRRQARKAFDEGLSLFEQRSYTKALEKFNFVKKVDPDWEGVDDLIRKAESAESESTELQKMLQEGMRLRDEKRFQDAIDLFRDILERDPDHAQARKGLELAIQDLSRFEEIKKLQDRWPKFFKQGQYTRAVEVLERLQTICPEKRDEFQKHIDDIRNRQEIRRNVERLVEQARQAQADRRFQQAVDLWSEARRLQPEDEALKDGEAEARKALAAFRKADAKVQACRKAVADGDLDTASGLLEEIDAQWLTTGSITKLKQEIRDRKRRKDKYRDDVRKALRNGRYEAAEQKLAEWKKEFPGDAERGPLETELKAALKRQRDADREFQRLIEREKGKNPEKTLEEARKLRSIHTDKAAVDKLIRRLEKRIKADERARIQAEREKEKETSRKEKKQIAEKPVREKPVSPEAKVSAEKRRPLSEPVIELSDRKTRPAWLMPGVAGIGIIAVIVLFFLFRSGGEKTAVRPEPTIAVRATATSAPEPTAVHVAVSFPTRAPRFTATPIPAVIPPTPTSIPVMIAPTAIPAPVEPTPTPVMRTSTTIPATVKPTAQPTTVHQRRLSDEDVQKIAAYLRTARQQIDKKQFRSALRTVESALAMDPFNKNTLKLKKMILDILAQSERSLKKARRLYAEGNLALAQKVLGDILQWDPENRDARELLRKLKEVRSAEPTATPVIQYAPPVVKKVDFPKSVRAEKDIKVTVVVYSETGLADAKLFYRTDQRPEWFSAKTGAVKPGKRRIVFVIPAAAVVGKTLYAYLQLVDPAGRVVEYSSADAPKAIKIKSGRRLPLGGM